MSSHFAHAAMSVVATAVAASDRRSPTRSRESNNLFRFEHERAGTANVPTPSSCGCSLRMLEHGSECRGECSRSCVKVAVEGAAGQEVRAFGRVVHADRRIFTPSWSGVDAHRTRRWQNDDGGTSPEGEAPRSVGLECNVCDHSDLDRKPERRGPQSRPAWAMP